MYWNSIDRVFHLHLKTCSCSASRKRVAQWKRVSGLILGFFEKKKRKKQEDKKQELHYCNPHFASLKLFDGQRDWSLDWTPSVRDTYTRVCGSVCMHTVGFLHLLIESFGHREHGNAFARSAHELNTNTLWQPPAQIFATKKKKKKVKNTIK